MNRFLRGNSRSPRGIGFWALVAATFFMVSGGTYGTEDIVRGAGFGPAIVVLLLTPLLWSLPTALMMAELAAAMPQEGGYYVWVRRALGDVWGFQEAWLSLAASVFDMAIYPTLFVFYLSRLFVWTGIGWHGIMIGSVVVLLCAALNLAGIRVVAGSSLWLFFALSAPFAAIALLAPFHRGALAHTGTAPVTDLGLLGGIMVAMWNYMGWDNASTVAAEVEAPDRTYPRAMLAALGIISLSYVLPVAAAWLTGVPSASFNSGFWADLAGILAGPWLKTFTVAAATASAFGMFNALVLSYSRLPLAMAEDGMLPRVFARVHPRTGAPWVSILALTIGWLLCLGLGFERLITLDILLYGGALLLEFAALVALRIRAPQMPRPFRVPGGTLITAALGVSPAILLGISMVRGSAERILGMNALLFGAGVVLLGFALYGLSRLRKALPLPAASAQETTSRFDG